MATKKAAEKSAPAPVILKLADMETRRCSDAAIQKLLATWSAQIEGYAAEMRRLERLDSSRHATSISMLSASAQP